jgi:hypothetical protein
MLSVYTRHYAPCPQTDIHYRRCRCPKWIRGRLRGEGLIRRSAHTRNWSQAERLGANLSAAPSSRAASRSGKRSTPISPTNKLESYLRPRSRLCARFFQPASLAFSYTDGQDEATRRHSGVEQSRSANFRNDLDFNRGCGAATNQASDE